MSHGSIITTPNPRKGYTKGGSPRMKISEKNTWKREVDYGIQQAKAGVAEANQGMYEAQAAINAMGAERSKPSPKPADVSSQFSEETLASGAVPNYSKHQRDLHRQARRRVVGKVRNVKNSRGQIIGN